jgi:hypothetical protein
MAASTAVSAAADVLAMARQLLKRCSSDTVGLWARSAALLGRQALEMSIDDYWAARNIPLTSCPTLQQLICLREYVHDSQLAGRVHHAWNALSRACHHHPYELPPSAAELDGWLQSVESWIAVVTVAAADRAPQHVPHPPGSGHQYR